MITSYTYRWKLFIFTQRNVSVVLYAISISLSFSRIPLSSFSISFPPPSFLSSSLSLFPVFSLSMTSLFFLSLTLSAFFPLFSLFLSPFSLLSSHLSLLSSFIIISFSLSLSLSLRVFSLAVALLISSQRRLSSLVIRSKASLKARVSEWIQRVYISIIISTN